MVARAKKGEKFSELARDNSDDVETAKNGGTSARSPRALMDKPSKTSCSTRKGLSSPTPDKRPNGFLILKVDEHYEAGQASFEEVENEIRNA